MTTQQYKEAGFTRYPTYTTFRTKQTVPQQVHQVQSPSSKHQLYEPIKLCTNRIPPIQTFTNRGTCHMTASPRGMHMTHSASHVTVPQSVIKPTPTYTNFYPNHPHPWFFKQQINHSIQQAPIIGIPVPRADGTLTLNNVLAILRFCTFTGQNVKCPVCNKNYKSKVCLTKHLWEHTVYWSQFQGIKNHEKVLCIQTALILTHNPLYTSLLVTGPCKKKAKSKSGEGDSSNAEINEPNQKFESEQCGPTEQLNTSLTAQDPENMLSTVQDFLHFTRTINDAAKHNVMCSTPLRSKRSSGDSDGSRLSSANDITQTSIQDTSHCQKDSHRGTSSCGFSSANGTLTSTIANIEDMNRRNAKAAKSAVGKGAHTSSSTYFTDSGYGTSEHPEHSVGSYTGHSIRQDNELGSHTSSLSETSGWLKLSPSSYTENTESTPNKRKKEYSGSSAKRIADFIDKHSQIIGSKFNKMRRISPISSSDNDSSISFTPQSSSSHQGDQSSLQSSDLDDVDIVDL